MRRNAPTFSSAMMWGIYSQAYFTDVLSGSTIAVMQIHRGPAAIKLDQQPVTTKQRRRKSSPTRTRGGVFAVTIIPLIDGGIVQQHRLIGAFDDGRAMPDLYACLVIKVRDAQIVSIEEYFDGSIYAEVWDRIARLSAA
jgi:hypothetical protein